MSELPGEVNHTTSVAAVRAALGGRDASRASAAEIEKAVLRVYKLDSISSRLWHESAAVCDRARKSVKQRLRARFGARSPRGGAITMLTLVLVFSIALPIGFLNAIRLGSPEGAAIAAIATVAIGGISLVLSLLSRFKPVSRPTLFQAQLLTVGLAFSAGIGAVITEGIIRMLFIAGAATGIAALIIFLIGRYRDLEATRQIDTGLENAFIDVTTEVTAERARMLDSLAGELSGRTDLDDIRALRSASIEAFRALGNEASDDDPRSLPGAYIIHIQTRYWLPITHNGLWPPTDK